MTKYLVALRSEYYRGVLMKKHERIPIREELAHTYITRLGDFTKEPDIAGKSYRDWFHLVDTDVIDGRRAVVSRPTARYVAPFEGSLIMSGIDITFDYAPTYGEDVTLIRSLPHPDGRTTVWAVQSFVSGRKFLIAEYGLMISGEALETCTIAQGEHDRIVNEVYIPAIAEAYDHGFQAGLRWAKFGGDAE